MKTNKTYIVLLLLGVIGLASCEKKLDIVPKGQVTLGKVSELELLLNQEYMLGNSPSMDLGIITGETWGMFDLLSSMMGQPNTSNYAYLTGDESIDRASLTLNDEFYSTVYRYINHMNVLISRIDDAEGDHTRAPQLKAEAQVMRGYLHWLIAGIYARQYDAAKADQLGGIAYSLSTDVTEVKQKLTLEQTYQQILTDISNANIALLPEKRDNSMRGDRAWGYAARAAVLFQMKRYDEALAHADSALALRSTIFDRSGIKTAGKWEQDESSENNYLMLQGFARCSPTFSIITPYTISMFEAGDYVRNYDTEGGWSASYGKMYSGVDGAEMLMTFTVNANVWGLTTEQIRYLQAECMIRKGELQQGLDIVNQIRTCRVENATPYAASTVAEAMKLLQRAKWVECIATPWNYFDLKRWNTEPEFQRTVTHNLPGYGKYSIAPESSIWVMPFPLTATRYNKTLTQNY